MLYWKNWNRYNIIVGIRTEVGNELGLDNRCLKRKDKLFEERNERERDRGRQSEELEEEVSFIE